MSPDLHHLSAAYALDALDDVERRQFENHYPTCEICSADVLDFRGVAAAMATSSATTAPASLKASVLSEISQTRQLSPLVDQDVAGARRNPLSGRVIAAAAAALVLLAGVVAVTLPGNGDPSSTEIAEAPDAIVTLLDPVGNDQPGNVQVVWSDELDGVVVIGSDLADPGVGKAYALWFLLDEGAIAPAGLFRPEGGSVAAVLAVDNIETAGWGISIEPAGGSPQPTTEVLFVGNV